MSLRRRGGEAGRGEPLHRHAAAEDRRVVGRRRCEREDRAVRRIERDDRAAVRVPAAVTGGRSRARHPELQRLLRGALDPDIDREADRAAGIRLHRRLELAVRIAEGVDTELGETRAAAEVAVVRSLDAGLADLVSRLVARGRVLQLLRRDLADVAEQLRCGGALRVVAQVGARGLDARELVLVLCQVPDHGLVDADLDRNGRQRITLARLDSRQHVADRDVDDARQQAQLATARLPRLRKVGRVELDRGAGAIVDEGHAVPVEDDAARRLHPDGAQLVVLRDAQVLMSRQDLERPQPEEERPEDDDRDRAEDRNAQCELRRQAVRLRRAGVRRKKGGGSAGHVSGFLACEKQAMQGRRPRS